MTYEDLAELVANVSPDVLAQMKKNSNILKACKEAAFAVTDFKKRIEESVPEKKGILRWEPGETADQRARRILIESAVPGSGAQQVMSESSKTRKSERKTASNKYHAVRNHPEDDFQKDCIDLLHLRGWTVAHFRKARTQKGWVTPVQADGKGFPDLVAVRDRPNLLGHTVMFIEVKSDKGKLTLEQTFWGELLLHAHADWSTWYPSKWEQIVKEVE